MDVSALAPVTAGLIAATVLLGATLYPAYRMSVRPFLAAHNLMSVNGAFEIKEHFAALALLSVPAYWALWRSPQEAGLGVARRALTYLLTAIVWWNFVTGHVLLILAGSVS